MDVRNHQTQTFGGSYVNAEPELPSQLRVGRQIQPNSCSASGWALIIVVAVLFVSFLVLMRFQEMPGL